MDSAVNITLKINNKKKNITFTLKTRLLRFYNKHCPEKIENIDEIIIKYSKKEKDLFKGLVSKYGKEPDISDEEKKIIKDRLDLQRNDIETKKICLKKDVEKKNTDHLDINTFPYDNQTLMLIDKIETYKGKLIPLEILSQI